MGPFFVKINFQKIPKHGSIFWAKSLNMGTFLTSKHGLGSRGTGGTPPSKPKSSTPPGSIHCCLALEALKILRSLLRSLEKSIQMSHDSFVADSITNKFFQGLIPSLKLYTIIIYYYIYHYHNLNNNDNYLKGVLHLLPKISTFCALSQNDQQLFEK